MIRKWLKSIILEALEALEERSEAQEINRAIDKFERTAAHFQNGFNRISVISEDLSQLRKFFAAPEYVDRKNDAKFQELLSKALDRAESKR